MQSNVKEGPVMAHGFRGAYGRLSPLTAPTALIGKVCNGSKFAVRHAVGG